MDTDSREGAVSNGADRVEAATDLTGERLAALAERARGMIAKAADRAGDAYGSARDRTLTTADATDAFVRANPYAAVGLAIFAGFVMGALFLGRGPKVIYIRPAQR